jgi:cell shape-determining protein MreC
MQPIDLYVSLDTEIVSQLLPLGDSVIGALVTLATALFTYVIGRRRNRAEVDNLQAEKKSIEAASGVSTAEAAQIISEAAAATVQPLVSRVQEQQKEIKYLTERVTWKRAELDRLRTENATLKSENMLLKSRFRLQGETPPELPPLPPEV